MLHVERNFPQYLQVRVCASSAVPLRWCVVHECGPCLHEFTSFLELVSTPVGRFRLVTDTVGQGMFTGLVRELAG